MTELEKLEGDVREAAAQRELKQAGDPSKSAEELIGDRLCNELDQLTDTAVSELRAQRDEIDNQMRALIALRDQEKSRVRGLVGISKQVIDVKHIAADAMGRLTQLIEADLSEPQPKVITARKGNGRT